MPPSKRLDHSAHGQKSYPSNGLNEWTKDTKTKTCKCRICGKRVSIWSWRCSLCSKSICSVCCEDNAGESEFYKRTAKDHVEHGCYCRRFPSGVNPALKKLKPALPPKQEEQWANDAAARKKAVETSAKKKAAAAKARSGEHSSKQPRRSEQSTKKVSESHSYSDAEDVALPIAEKTLRPRTEPKSYQVISSDDDSSEASVFEEFASATERFGRPAEEDVEDLLSSPLSRLNKAVPRSAPSRPTAVGLGHTNRKSVLLNTLGVAVNAPSPSKKRAPKRKSTAAGLDEDYVFAADPGDVRGNKTATPLDNGHTVIIGAGFIGLFAAYQLATRCKDKHINHKVTVLEIRSNVCELASGQCAGFITIHGMDNNETWSELWQEAQKAWAGLAQQRDAKGVGFINRPLFFAEPIGDGDDEGMQTPPWFRPGAIHYVGKDQLTSARLDPGRLARWLTDQCVSLGVRFRFEQSIQCVHQGLRDDGYQLELGLPGTSKVETVDCSHLVFAAGPFTTFLVNKLFNGGRCMNLGNTNQQYVWMEVGISLPEPEAEVGITAKVPKEDDDWSAGIMSMVVPPGSQTVRVSAAQREIKARNMTHEHALHPDRAPWESLVDLSADCLGYKVGQQITAQRAGGALVSVANGRRPCIDRLRIPRGVGVKSTEVPNVLLFYGFGRWGTTLAPGAARMLVGMMLGEQ